MTKLTSKTNNEKKVFSVSGASSTESHPGQNATSTLHDAQMVIRGGLWTSTSKPKIDEKWERE